MNIQEFLDKATNEGNKLGLDTSKIRVEFSLWNGDRKPSLGIVYYSEEGHIGTSGESVEECFRKLKNIIEQENDPIRTLEL